MSVGDKMNSSTERLTKCDDGLAVGLTICTMAIDRLVRKAYKMKSPRNDITTSTYRAGSHGKQLRCPNLSQSDARARLDGSRVWRSATSSIL